MSVWDKKTSWNKPCFSIASLFTLSHYTKHNRKLKPLNWIIVNWKEVYSISKYTVCKQLENCFVLILYEVLKAKIEALHSWCCSCCVWTAGGNVQLHLTLRALPTTKGKLMYIFTLRKDIYRTNTIKGKTWNSSFNWKSVGIFVKCITDNPIFIWIVCVFNHAFTSR